MLLDSNWSGTGACDTANKDWSSSEVTSTGVTLSGAAAATWPNGSAELGGRGAEPAAATSEGLVTSSRLGVPRWGSKSHRATVRHTQSPLRAQQLS